MAKKDNNGLWHGRNGNLIYYVINGVQHSRIVCANFQDAETPQQQLQREKLTIANKLFVTLKPVVRYGFQASAKSKVQSEFISTTSKNALIETADKVSVDFSKLTISRGLIPEPADISAIRNGNQLHINWTPALSEELANINDYLVVCLLTDENKLVKYEEAATREAGSVTLDLPERFTEHFNLYAFYYNPKNDVKESRVKISDSVYLGRY